MRLDFRFVLEQGFSKFSKVRLLDYGLRIEATFAHQGSEFEEHQDRGSLAGLCSDESASLEGVKVQFG
jgi:hypothetical protein